MTTESKPVFRKSNTIFEFGQIQILTGGFQPDDKALAKLGINQADDYTLVRALANRGYNVRVWQPKPGEVERRQKRAAARQLRLSRLWKEHNARTE